MWKDSSAVVVALLLDFPIEAKFLQLLVLLLFQSLFPVCILLFIYPGSQGNIANLVSLKHITVAFNCLVCLQQSKLVVPGSVVELLDFPIETEFLQFLAPPHFQSLFLVCVLLSANPGSQGNITSLVFMWYITVAFTLLVYLQQCKFALPAVVVVALLDDPALR